MGSSLNISTRRSMDGTPPFFPTFSECLPSKYWPRAWCLKRISQRNWYLWWWRLSLTTRIPVRRGTWAISGRCSRSAQAFNQSLVARPSVRAWCRAAMRWDFPRPRSPISTTGRPCPGPRASRALSRSPLG